MSKRNSWKKWFSLGTLTTDLVFGNFMYVLFLAFLGMIYIANAHLAESRVREIQSLERDIKKLKWEYMSIKRGVLLQSLQSELDENVKEEGLRLGRSGPKVIKVKD